MRSNAPRADTPIAQNVELALDVANPMSPVKPRPNEAAWARTTENTRRAWPGMGCIPAATLPEMLDRTPTLPRTPAANDLPMRLPTPATDRKAACTRLISATTDVRQLAIVVLAVFQEVDQRLTVLRELAVRFPMAPMTPRTARLAIRGRNSMAKPAVPQTAAKPATAIPATCNNPPSASNAPPAIPIPTATAAMVTTSCLLLAIHSPAAFRIGVTAVTSDVTAGKMALPSSTATSASVPFNRFI